MEYKRKNREWVKSAAIIFLSVLLVLTFFSNTWMNRSLPEVATQYVTNGTITAKVRGSGTVSAVGVTSVKADRTREIRAVMVKVGQEVKVGDVLFVLGQGEASELEAAQEQLRQLQLGYQKAAVGIGYYDYSLQERQIQNARNALLDAQNHLEEVIKRQGEKDLPIAQLNAAKEDAAAKAAELDEAKTRTSAANSSLENYLILKGSRLEELNNSLAIYDSYQDSLTKAKAYEQELEQKWYNQQGMDPSKIPPLELVTEEMLGGARENVRSLQDLLTDFRFDTGDAVELTAERDAIQSQIDEKKAEIENAEAAESEAQTAYDDAAKKLKAVQATIDEIIGKDAISTEYKEAKQAVQDAEDKLFSLEYDLQQKKQQDSQSQSLDYLNLSDIGAQIENAKKKVKELSGGEENQITAKAAGIIQTVDCAPGDTKLKGDLLCTIEVPDLGYTMSFSVTNDQARRLKPGDSATVSNYYWGNQIVATLESIKADPKNPQTNKLLTFTVEGDVNPGAELTISVGQKSATYDIIVPNSSIRSDTNGSFVLAIESKNSPLGNRYIARRVPVNVLAEDDMNSAVTGDLGFGDYVITTSNAPVKNGDMVRLSDNG